MRGEATDATSLLSASAHRILQPISDYLTQVRIHQAAAAAERGAARRLEAHAEADAHNAEADAYAAESGAARRLEAHAEADAHNAEADAYNAEADAPALVSGGGDGAVWLHERGGAPVTGPHLSDVGGYQHRSSSAPHMSISQIYEKYLSHSGPGRGEGEGRHPGTVQEERVCVCVCE